MSSTHANSLLLAHNSAGSKVVLQADASKHLICSSRISDGTNALTIESDGASHCFLRAYDGASNRSVLVDSSGKLQVVAEMNRPNKTTVTIANDSTATALSGSFTNALSSETVTLTESNKIIILVKGCPSTAELNLEVSDDDSVWHASSVSFYANTNDGGSTYDIVGSHDSMVAPYVRVKNTDTVPMTFSSFTVTHQ